MGQSCSRTIFLAPIPCLYTLNNSAPRAINLAGVATVAQLKQRLTTDVPSIANVDVPRMRVLVGAPPNQVEYGDNTFAQLVQQAANDHQLVINIFTPDYVPPPEPPVMARYTLNNSPPNPINLAGIATMAQLRQRLMADVPSIANVDVPRIRLFAMIEGLTREYAPAEIPELVQRAAADDTLVIDIRTVRPGINNSTNAARDQDTQQPLEFLLPQVEIQTLVPQGQQPQTITVPDVLMDSGAQAYLILQEADVIALGLRQMARGGIVRGLSGDVQVDDYEYVHVVLHLDDGGAVATRVMASVIRHPAGSAAVHPQYRFDQRILGYGSLSGFALHFDYANHRLTRMIRRVV